MRRLAILGSTGSIGQNALEVVAGAGDRFHVAALAAGRNLELLARQVARFRPELAVVQRRQDQDKLRELLQQAGAPVPALAWGGEGLLETAGSGMVELLLNGLVGAVGLPPTLAALERGCTVALANKESLAMAGQLCMETARRSGSTLLPVDSEHSAIFQCLRGQAPGDVRRLILTGSGGPFREGFDDLSGVTVEQALHHPVWPMGRKISVDSATLMNKGLEVIEAHWLFGVPPAQIEVLIHAQSIVHSMVELVDGSVLAQLSEPDMRLPIAYALAFPHRLPLGRGPMDLRSLASLTFTQPDRKRFPCLELAYHALSLGGTAPAALNAANEVAVEAFLAGALGFLEIPSVVRDTLASHAVVQADSLVAVLKADAGSRQEAGDLVRARPGGNRPGQ